jgi:two-component system response regulator PilR (NtrC family)
MTAPRLGVSALEVLARYPFPGNVRELENVLERALALAETDTLEARDLYLPARGPGGPAQGPWNPSVGGTSGPMGAPVALSSTAGNHDGLNRMGDPAPQNDAATKGQSASLPVPPTPASRPGDASTAGTASGDPDTSLVEAIDAIQRQVILRTLEETRWNLPAAAKQLGLSPRSMRYRLVKLGIE